MTIHCFPAHVIISHVIIHFKEGGSALLCHHAFLRHRWGWKTLALVAGAGKSQIHWRCGAGEGQTPSMNSQFTLHPSGKGSGGEGAKRVSDSISQRMGLGIHNKTPLFSLNTGSRDVSDARVGHVLARSCMVPGQRNGSEGCQES